MSLHGELFLSEVEMYLTTEQVSEIYTRCEDLEGAGASGGAVAAAVIPMVVRYALGNAGIQPDAEVRK